MLRIGWYQGSKRYCIINNPVRTPSETPEHLTFHPQWDTIDGDISLVLVGPKWNQIKMGTPQ